MLQVIRLGVISLAAVVTRITSYNVCYTKLLRAHQGQYRTSGEPYITHPVAVTQLVADWHLDPQALMAALLHDVMEDTHVTKEELTERFGKVTAELVDGLSSYNFV